jgi:hypothetical protein
VGHFKVVRLSTTCGQTHGSKEALGSNHALDVLSGSGLAPSGLSIAASNWGGHPAHGDARPSVQDTWAADLLWGSSWQRTSRFGTRICNWPSSPRQACSLPHAEDLCAAGSHALLPRTGVGALPCATALNWGGHPFVSSSLELGWAPFKGGCSNGSG